MTIEERVKEVIRNFEATTLGKLNAANEAGKEEIREYVETFVRNLSIEFPMAIKDILDRGGSVRQVISTSPVNLFDTDQWIKVHDFGKAMAGLNQSRVRFDEIQPETECRITIIVEPISK